MEVIHHSQKEIDKALAVLAANKNDIVKTADQLGISIDILYKFKKQALLELDLKQVKQSKDIIGAGHKLILSLLQSKEFKQKFYNAETPLKEVTDFITKILKMLKEYQEILGFSAIDIKEAIDEIPSVDKGRRRAQEDGFSLVDEEEEQGEVKDININTKELLVSEEDTDFANVQ